MDGMQSITGQLLPHSRPGGRMSGCLRPALLVACPVRRLVPSELVQVPPGEQSRVMAVVEDNFDGILADGLDGPDADSLFAQHQDLLSRAVSFDFRGGRMNAQVLEGQLKPAAIGKTHLQQARFAADFDFGRDGITHICTSIGSGL